MKKIFSLLLAGLMVASMAVMPVAAESPAQQTNVEVEVLAMTTVPTFDGVINADEWGDPTFVAEGKDGVALGATAYSPTNTFIMSNGPDAKGTADRMDMKMWYRWDNDFLYIAVDVLDDNGYYCDAGRDSMWGQDVLQFFIDPVGPNGMQKNNEPDYDYKTTGFDYATYERPWSASNGVPNITAGYVSSVTREAYQLYNANTSTMIAAANGEKKLNESYGGWFMMTPATAEVPRTVYEMAIPWDVVSYNAEVVIDEEKNTSRQFGVGKVLGLSMMYQNIPSVGGFDQGFDATDSYTMSSICWGSGIPGFQHEDGKYESLGGTDEAIATADMSFTNGGSNALVLVSKDKDGNEVDGLVTWDDTVEEIAHAEQALYGAAGAGYLGSGLPVLTGDLYVEMDIALLDWSVTDEASTSAAFVIGSDYVTTEEASDTNPAGKIDHYSIAAGYDYSTQTFVIGDWNTTEGFKAKEPAADETNEAKKAVGYNRWAESEVVNWTVGNKYEGVAAEWGTMGLQVIGETATLYFNGEKVLEYTTPAITIAEDGTVSGGQYGDGITIATGISDPVEDREEPAEIITYITGERLMDNLIIGQGSDYVFGSKATGNCANVVQDYSFDTTDSKFLASFMYGGNVSTFPLVTVSCNNEESDYLVGHNEGILAANETTVMKGCHYCEEIEITYEANDGSYAVHNVNRIPADITPPPPPDLVRGDLDGDKEVGNKDAALLIRLVAGFENVNIAENAVVDFDNDGESGNKDIALLLRFIAGLIEEL